MTSLPTSPVLSETMREDAPVSNARLIAELQAATIGIHLVGLDRLPEVMAPAQPQTQDPS